MRVFVAGASGAIGTRLVPQLIERGHEVIGTSRSPGNAERVRALGAQPIVLDLLDRDAVIEAVAAAEPDAIVHQATALADVKFSSNLDRTFAQTNRLRTEGTDALVDAVRAAGVRRFVAQSFASFRYAREGGPVKTEDDPLDPNPVSTTRETNAAMRYLDQAVVDAGGIALRYGGFYGAANDGLLAPVRKRQFPIVGEGGGVSSFIHLDDAAAATVLALEHDGGPAVYNVVDDDPAPGARVAAGARERPRRRASAPLPALARAAVRRRSRRVDGHGVARRLQREGQARARLDAPLPQLARGLRGRLRLTRSTSAWDAAPHGGHDRGRRPGRAHQLLVRGRHALPRSELAGGAAHAFKVLERALALLDPDGPCERREIVIETAFGGPGARDAFEMVTRAVTGDRFRVDPALARPQRGRALEAFVFRLGYRDRSTTLTVREGFVTDEFIDLARTEHRDADQERRLDALKRDMAERVLAHPASEVYDADAGRDR